MPIKFFALGGVCVGVFWRGGGGGSANFIFMGAGIFLIAISVFSLEDQFLYSGVLILFRILLQNFQPGV